MKKYKLIVVGGDDRLTGEYENVVNGFVEAERRAEELLNEYIEGYPDAYVALFEKDEPFYCCYDFLIYKADYFGDRYWRMMVASDGVILCDRLLEDYENEELEELRNEKEVHVYDLNEEELKQLRREVCIGSCFLASYKNSFEIDEEEVYSMCEAYDYYLCTDEDGKQLPESEWEADTPEMFAWYCINM